MKVEVAVLSSFVLSWCFMFKETIRLMENGGGERGREIIYTYRYTVTARMTSVLRLAALRAILMLH